MFVPEPLLLTLILATCKFMVTFSTPESNPNQTYLRILTSVKESDVTLASTIVKKSTHQDLLSSHAHLATRSTPGGLSAGLSLQTEMGRDLATGSTPDILSVGLSLQTEKGIELATRNETETSPARRSQHVDMNQVSLDTVNGSENSAIERSFRNPHVREPVSNHTLETNSPNGFAVKDNGHNVSVVSDETLQLFNSSNLEETDVNIASPRSISLEKKDINSNNWGDGNNNWISTGSSVYRHQTSTFTTIRQALLPEVDFSSRTNPTVITQTSKTTTLQTLQVGTIGYGEIVLEVGGKKMIVCELDMLCRDRCLQGANAAASIGKTAMFSNVTLRDILKGAQDTTPTYHKSVKSEAPHKSGSERFRRHASMDTYSRQSRTLHTVMNLDYSPWKLNEGSNESRHNSHTLRSCPNSSKQACFCDDLCVLHGDCCPDVFTSCFQLNATKDILSFISGVWTQHVRSTSSDNPQETLQSSMNMVLKYLTCQRINVTTEVLLVSTCPEDFKNVSIKNSCENSSEISFPPVSASFSDGDVSFLNIFCARCHGVKDTEGDLWSSQFTCEKNATELSKKSLLIKDLEKLVRGSVCNISFIPPANVCVPRQCQRYSRLSDDQKEVLKKRVDQGICSEADSIFCQSYYYPASDFANVHCRTCLQSKQRSRRDSEDQYICDLGLYGDRQKAQILSSSIRGGILLILDVTGTFSSSDKSQSVYICKQNEVFDPKLLACRFLYCLSGFRPYRGKCIEIPGHYFGDGDLQIFPYEWEQLVLIIRKPNSSGFPCEVSSAITTSRNARSREMNTNIMQSLRLSSKDMKFDYSTSDCWRFAHGDDTLKEMLVEMLTIIFNLLSETADKRTELTTELNHAELFNETHHIEVSNINRSTTTSYKCSGNNSLRQVQDFIVTEYNGSVYVLVNLSQREIYYPLKNVGFQVTLSRDTDRSGKWTLNQSVHICDTWLSLGDNCSMVKYNLNETLYNGSHLMILYSGQYYNPGDFQISGDEVFVCTNFSFRYYPITDVIHQSLTFLVVSWALTIISILSLLLMLLLYCLFPELCTLPGKMTASLATAMMLTFVLSLFSLLELHHDYICPIVAVLNHVIALAQFGWMSAIAVNMALTFGPQNNKLVRTVSDKTFFLRYNLVVYGSSLVIVTTSVILDLTHPEPNSSSESRRELPLLIKYPRYGYPYCTWFSGPMWTKLAFVLIPYLITFVISLAGFLLTLIGIQQASKSAQKLGKKSSDKTRCLIYLKLSSAMGFSWAVSAVSNIYPNIVALSYIYLCLILVQGLLLFLAFMVNYRVYFLVRRKFWPKGDECSTGGTLDSSIVISLTE